MKLVSLAQVGQGGGEPRFAQWLAVVTNFACWCCILLHSTNTCCCFLGSLQMNNGVLDEAQAMRLVNGLAGPIPPPRMHGLAIPKGIDMQGPGAAPPSTTPGRQPAYAAGAPPPGSMPGMQMPQAPGGYPGGYPGAGMPPQAALAGFPPLTPEQANAFQAAFTQLDLDRDGYVQVRQAQGPWGRCEGLNAGGLF